ncbi:MAG: carboxypeptidase-like regulatory domain-containing protein [Acidobacteriota bacterium]|nr:carboxypeptidase-like regulatory domain-containing protein [Blastocatellia bacterium]MDW8412202.1 carboxypeptidase-like regulatory domain-containing protein [Acidobacteriota bacterium]
MILLLLFLLSSTGAIAGKVVDEAGRAVAKATVKASCDDKEFLATTNEKGEFMLEELPPGDYLVTVEAKGYKRVELVRRQRVDAGRTIKLAKIELPTEYVLLRGAVFTSSGYSLPGAKVTISRLDGQKYKKEYITSEAGSFAFRLPPDGGKYEVRASAKGFREARQVVELAEGEIRSIALSLEAQ